MFAVLLHEGGGSPGKFSFSAIGRESKIALGRGTVFWRVSLWESPPSPFPCPPMVHLYIRIMGSVIAAVHVQELHPVAHCWRRREEKRIRSSLVPGVYGLGGKLSLR